MAASQFNVPNLCFFSIVCILCAHTRAGYVILGLTTVRKILLSSLGCGPLVGIDTFWLLLLHYRSESSMWVWRRFVLQSIRPSTGAPLEPGSGIQPIWMLCGGQVGIKWGIAKGGSSVVPSSKIFEEQPRGWALKQPSYDAALQVIWGKFRALGFTIFNGLQFPCRKERIRLRLVHRSLYSLNGFKER